MDTDVITELAVARKFCKGVVLVRPGHLSESDVVAEPFSSSEEEATKEEETAEKEFDELFVVLAAKQMSAVHRAQLGAYRVDVLGGDVFRALKAILLLGRGGRVPVSAKSVVLKVNPFFVGALEEGEDVVRERARHQMARLFARCGEASEGAAHGDEARVLVQACEAGRLVPVVRGGEKNSAAGGAGGEEVKCEEEENKKYVPGYSAAGSAARWLVGVTAKLGSEAGHYSSASAAAAKKGATAAANNAAAKKVPNSSAAKVPNSSSGPPTKVVGSAGGGVPPGASVSTSATSPKSTTATPKPAKSAGGQETTATRKEAEEEAKKRPVTPPINKKPTGDTKVSSGSSSSSSSSSSDSSSDSGSSSSSSSS